MSDLVDGVDLEYHGDRAVTPGLLDLAVNVSTEPMPGWLVEAVTAACGRLAGYPDPAEATATVAAYHRRPVEQTLLTSGAAEAFGLVARAVSSTAAVVVHPQFTEPERALRIAGHRVRRHLLRAEDGFRLDPAAVPDDADLVVLGNPTNPTGVLHPAAAVLALVRPGRTLVVDEAFMDSVPGEPESLAGVGDVPGLVVVRSLTKTWGLAGLRIGYLLAPAPMVEAMRVQQAPWSVSTPALAAAEACVGQPARVEVARRSAVVERHRERLREALTAVGLVDVPGSRGPFLLCRSPGGRVLTEPLRRRGIAVRRCDTFPGLGADWIRVAVRDGAATQALVTAVAAELDSPAAPSSAVLSPAALPPAAPSSA